MISWDLLYEYEIGLISKKINQCNTVCKTEIKKTIPLITASKRIKCLNKEINLREVQDL